MPQKTKNRQVLGDPVRSLMNMLGMGGIDEQEPPISAPVFGDPSFGGTAKFAPSLAGKTMT